MTHLPLVTTPARLFRHKPRSLTQTPNKRIACSLLLTMIILSQSQLINVFYSELNIPMYSYIHLKQRGHVMHGLELHITLRIHRPFLCRGFE